jgi:hypothetical protein
MFNEPRQVLAMIKPGDRVLDVGGAGKIFPRANVVVDILKYDRRKPGAPADMPEAFSKDDWYVGDICSTAVWSHFKNKEFDFVICSHTLEDIRDPIYVCSQMIRVGKAGYIETPSRFRECAKANPNDLVSGWDHHRWIVDVVDGKLIFTPKLSWAHLFDYIGDHNRQHVHDFLNQFTAVQWVGSFDYCERMTKGVGLESENLFFFYENYPYSDPPSPVQQVEHVTHTGQTFVRSGEFRLPIEEVFHVDAILERHLQRVACIRDSVRAT